MAPPVPEPRPQQNERPAGNAILRFLGFPQAATAAEEAGAARQEPRDPPPYAEATAANPAAAVEAETTARHNVRGLLEDARRRQIVEDEALARRLQREAEEQRGYPDREQEAEPVDDGPPPHEAINQRRGWRDVPLWYWRGLLFSCIMAAILALASPWRRLAESTQVISLENIGWSAYGTSTPSGSVHHARTHSHGTATQNGTTTHSFESEPSIQSVYAAPWSILLHALWPALPADGSTPLTIAGAWAMTHVLQPGSFVRSFWWLLLIGIPVIVTALVSLLSSLPLARLPVEWVQRHHKLVRASVWATVASIFVLEGLAMMANAVLGPGAWKKECSACSPVQPISRSNSFSFTSCEPL
jgi:hypothetical protein